MPKIYVSANNYVTESMGVVSVFIDQILPLNIPVIAEVFFVGGTASELQEITSGSTFKSPLAAIEKIKFINENGVAVDIEYHTSSLLEYDERKVIGDVNALTRSDNISRDGGCYTGGYLHTSAGVGSYAFSILWNDSLTKQTVVKSLSVQCNSAGGAFRIGHAFSKGACIDISPDSIVSKNTYMRNNETVDLGIIGGGSLVTIDTMILPGPAAPATPGEMNYFNFREMPFILAPGAGLGVVSVTDNATMSVLYDFVEELI